MVQSPSTLLASTAKVIPTIASSKVPVSSIASTLVLSRNPIITQDISGFEKKYYEYQSELQKRLMWTFPKYFYYKKGTLSEQQFNALQKYPVSKQPGVWFPKGEPELRHNRDRRFKQEVILPKTYEKGKEYDSNDMSRPVKFNSRTTKADETNDTKSLERKLSRTLYLIIKENQWKFPSFKLSPELEQPLHTTAIEGIKSLGGEFMNLWHVSNTPAHVLKFANNKLVTKSGADATAADAASLTREFIIKSHILSGSFQPQSNIEYAWLTKEEISQHIPLDYYKEIQHLLNDN